MTVRDAISLAGGVLGGADGWRLDAEVLLGHVLGWRRIEIFSRPEQALSPDEEVRYRALLERRSRHEPVAYITGQREFYGRPFEVGPGVLVPRPESEMLVDIVLAHCREQKHDLRMIDIGTGSGALAVTLALEIPSAHVWASDCSVQALGWAWRNARRLLPVPQGARPAASAEPADDTRGWTGECANLHLAHGDCFAQVAGRFDIVVSNPPYLTRDELAGAMPDVRDWEPALALVAEDNGMAVYRDIIGQLPARLAPHGLAVFEISDTVARDMHNEARRAGFGCTILPDLAGHQRVAVLKTLSE
jgi:release factor glutamine methyltransferase